jgi:hypothetical protein
LIPIVLDLFLWLGPRLSASPLVGPVVASPQFDEALRGAGMSSEEARRQFITAAEEFNLLSSFALGMPSVPAVVPALNVGSGPFRFVDSAAESLLVILASIVLGGIIGCVYRIAIARVILDQPLTPSDAVGRSLVSWLRITAMIIVTMAGLFVLAAPLALLLSVIGMFAREVAGVAMAFLFTLLLWLCFYLFFAQDAVFITNSGPIAALRNSMLVVRSYFWASLRIIGLTLLIMFGMMQVWVSLADKAPWGTAISVLGNAYITSGLVAASMLFYRDRFAAMRAPVAAAASA